jgi:hypothetical protein
MQQSYEAEELETNDLGLASFLTLNGHRHIRTQWRDGVHFWFFTIDEDVSELFDRWLNHEATAELRGYNRIFGRLKRGLVASRPR